MTMETLRGQLAGPPNAVSWGPDRVDVFGVGTDQQLWHWWQAGAGGWGGPEPRGGSLPGEGVSAVSWGPNRLDVFAAGQPNNNLYHWWWDGRAWGGPQSLGGSLPAETVSAVSWGPNRLDVFAPGQPGNQLYHWSWDGARWNGPEARGGVMNAEGVSAVSWAPNRLDVFAVEAGSGQLLHWQWDGSWHDALPLGGRMRAETVSAVSWGPNRIDVFAVEDGTGQLLHWSWDGSRWNGPERRAGFMNAEGVTAVTKEPNRITVFGIEAGTGKLLRWFWDGINWKDSVGISPDAALPAGDLSAVERAPHQIDVFARAADNSLHHWPGGIGGGTTTPWTNWGGNLTVPHPAGHCYAGSLEELVAIVKQAEAIGKKVRAVGSSWSFSDAALTTDYVVETTQLNRVLTHIVGAPPLWPQTGPPIGGVLKAGAPTVLHVEAGMILDDLNGILDVFHLALKTMGGSSGQTLAGIISTSVHGADFHFGPVPDLVRAIHLVGPGGVQHWIEPSQGITDPVGLQSQLGIDAANIHYDDDWFNSVLVSVGTMGIIYSLILEVQPQYDLVETCRHLPWADAKALLKLPDTDPSSPFASLPDGTAKRTVQVAIDPAAPHNAYLITRTQGAATLPATPSSSDPLGAFCTQDILHMTLQNMGLVALAPLILLAFPFLAPVIVLGIGAAVLEVALKAAGPGAVGDFVAWALNRDAGLTAQVATALTNMALPDTTAQPKVGFAHTVMAGTRDAECATRGLGLELNFDASPGSTVHLDFIDAALAMFDADLQRTPGLALSGWLSMRFVGRSRAYLSPQRFDRTCTVESVGLRGMDSTVILLGSLEMLGKKFGAIQHWGMHSPPALVASDVQKAYGANLNKWLKVRSQLTNGGALHTFNSEFADRCGLTSLPTADAPNINVNGTSVASGFMVTMSVPATTPNAAIHYTINNSTPVSGSQLYGGDFPASGVTVMAITVAPGFLNSPIATQQVP
jgi:FAD binding domain/Repeat of unknown function (DUF346)